MAVFLHTHHCRKTMLVDHMVRMMERYTDNLEELVEDRTDALEQEKLKTENLLNSMLPRYFTYSIVGLCPHCQSANTLLELFECLVL